MAGGRDQPPYSQISNILHLPVLVSKAPLYSAPLWSQPESLMYCTLRPWLLPTICLLVTNAISILHRVHNHYITVNLDVTLLMTLGYPVGVGVCPRVGLCGVPVLSYQLFRYLYHHSMFNICFCWVRAWRRCMAPGYVR
jgi:hypothetical protein